MRFYLDLHIHTCFSDGFSRLSDVLAYSINFHCISITDHNTLNGYLRLADQLENQTYGQCRFLPGVELRLPWLPDYLVYFPRLIDRKTLLQVQKWLERIDELDQLITIYVAKDYITKKLLPNKELISLWKSIDPCATCTKRFFGTMQLAKLIATYNSDCDWKKMVLEVRKYKSAILKYPPDELYSKAKELLDIASPDSVVAMAKNYNGEVVLAHPLRELARANKEKMPLNEKSILDGLERISQKYIKKGMCVEYIIHYCDGWWKKNFAIERVKANKILKSWSLDLGLKMTIGTDAHSLKKKEREQYITDLQNIPGEIYHTLPDWLVNFLTES